MTLRVGMLAVAVPCEKKAKRNKITVAFVLKLLLLLHTSYLNVESSSSLDCLNLPDTYFTITAKRTLCAHTPSVLYNTCSVRYYGHRIGSVHINIYNMTMSLSIWYIFKA